MKAISHLAQLVVMNSINAFELAVYQQQITQGNLLFN